MILHDVGLAVIIGSWWILDWILRYVVVGWRTPQVAPTVATVKAVTSSVVEVKFRRNFHFEAGQFLRVAIPEIGGLQFHPATLSSAPYDSDATLHFKDMGGWTHQLLQASKNHECQMKIFVEGPYGNLSLNLKSHSHVLLVCGGIGATPIVSLARQLIFEQQKQSNNLHVHVVWVVRNLDLVSVLPIVDPEILDIEQEKTSSYTDSPEPSDEVNLAPCPLNSKSSNLVIDIYVTKNQNDESSSQPSLPYGPYRIHYGTRPDMDSIIQQERTGSMAVIACGPKPLVHATAVACRKHSHCGNAIEFHNEIFDY